MQSSILVVDDDEKVLDILEKSLSKKGYEVNVAIDGKEALRYYRERTPDLVVLDMMLPDLNGCEVLARMRAVGKKQYVPVLFLSANSDVESRLAGLDVGAEDYLTKPFSLKELNLKVSKALDRVWRTRKLEQIRHALETEVTREQENYLQLNKELKKQLLAMKTLFSISQDLNRLLDSEELINVFGLTIVGELQISMMAFFALERDNSKTFTLQGIKGMDRNKIKDFELARDSEFAKWLSENKRPMKIVRVRDTDWAVKLPDLRLAIFEYATPIIVKQQLKGIVFTSPKISKKEYSIYELDMLMSICNSAGIGLENSRLFKQLQITYLSTVKTLVSIIEAKDAYTKGHTERVANYAMLIAANMKLSKEERRQIAFAAVLHDIGKLGVYEGVLNKSGTLSEEEWELLRKHPEVGAGIISNMEFLASTIVLVRHHHERYDGKGYPSGLAGDDIPLGARIIAVADSFDAMTTDRAYRKAMSWKKGIKTLKEKAGTQFDPKVVDAFVPLLESGVITPMGEPGK